MKRLSVKKGNKRRGLVFEFEELENVVDSMICEKCSYKIEICNKIPNPEIREKIGFMRFCLSAGKKAVPLPGSLERYYGKLIEEIKKKEKNL